MQRTGVNGRRIAVFIIAVFIVAALVFLDRFTKVYVKYLWEEEFWRGTTVIDGFFYITYTQNSGAAWSFMADVTWAQTFFKILTVVALVLFIFYFWYANKKGYVFLSVSVLLLISGALGNFIDRVANPDYVIDFISLVFGTYRFPVFNLADAFMTVGVIMLIIHYLFIDKNALFKSGKKKTENG